VDPRDFFAASRVIIVAGKGGVGKTAGAAGIARAAAMTGRDTLLIEIAGRTASAEAFGRREPLGYDAEILLAPPVAASRPASGNPPHGTVRGRTLTPNDALVDYLEGQAMGPIARRLASSGALEVVATATPGIKDLLILGKIKQLARHDSAELIVVDAPAAGHAIAFLRSPRALLDTARVGAIARQAQEALALLHDAALCQVVLVTLAEETPVNELIETAYALEDEVGVRLGPVIVNAVYPVLEGLGDKAGTLGRAAGHRYRRPESAALDAAASLRHRRQDRQQAQIARLAATLPLEQILLPHLFTPTIGPLESQLLAEAFLDGVRGLAPVPT
jgi:arsenite-transporting ATPase